MDRVVVAPPRIPFEVRREAIAKAEAALKRGKLRRRASYSGGKSSSTYAWLSKPVDASPPTGWSHSLPARSSTASRENREIAGDLNNKNKDNTGGGSACAHGPNSGRDCTRKSSGSLTLKQVKHPQQASGGVGRRSCGSDRGTICPPITRRVSLDSAQILSRQRLRPGHSAESDLGGTGFFNPAAEKAAAPEEAATAIAITCGVPGGSYNSNNIQRTHPVGLKRAMSIAGGERVGVVRRGTACHDVGLMSPGEQEQRSRAVTPATTACTTIDSNARAMDAKVRFEALRGESGNRQVLTQLL